MSNYVQNSKIIHKFGKTYVVPDGDFKASDYDLTEFLNDNPNYFIRLNDLTGLSNLVDSVNGQIGVVTLDQDDISDGVTYKQFSATEKTKLASIASGAEVNVNADWNSISGDSLILNKPTIPTSFNVTDICGINILGGLNNITLGFKTLGRIKSTGIITGYQIDSYELDTNNPIIGSISIEIYKNSSLIGTCILSSNSTVLNNTLSGWTTNITKGDKIQYKVISNSGIKNITLTIFSNNPTI